VQKGVDKVKKAVLTYMVLGIALLVLAPSAKANVLLPGGTVAPDAPNVNGGIIADTGWQNFSYPGTTGEVLELVVADNTNPYGAGDMSFIYQVQITGGGHPAVVTLSGYDYTGWQTDVQAGCEVGDALLPCAGSTMPVNVTRTADGSSVNFNFTPELGAGMWSYSLIIATDATSIVPGSIGVQDGGGTTANGYAPGVPEPATLSLIGMGLLSLLGLRKKQNA